MKITRRQTLATFASALLVGCKTPKEEDTEPLEPGDWTPAGSEDLDRFPYGLQSGDATATGVVLGVRTDEATVRFQVVKTVDAGWREVASETVSTDDGVAQIELDGLESGTRYSWVVFAEDDESRTFQGWFRTAPATGSPVVRFGATSCLGGNRPWPLLTRAAEEDLDLFLFLGDTIYADWGGSGSVKQKWIRALEQSGLQDITSSTSVLATWDDHEVWNNWNWDQHGDLVEPALSAFRRSLPQRPGPSGGIWRSVRWGDTVEFFVLDCRSERRDGDYISPEQLVWLKAGLRDSTARFKVILNSVPITDLSFIPVVGEIEADDRWQGHAEQRQELLDVCADVEGVLFISGDFHVGAAAYIDPVETPTGHIVEVLAGPGGSPVDDRYSLVPVGGRFLAAITEHNYTLFECNPDTGNIDVFWIDNDGAVIDTIRVPA